MMNNCAYFAGRWVQPVLHAIGRPIAGLQIRV